MQSAGEGFAESVKRVESRRKERRAGEQGFEMERKRVSVGADGEGYRRFEQVSAVSISGEGMSWID